MGYRLNECFQLMSLLQISTTIPPLFEFAKLFGSDEVLWIGIFTVLHSIA